MAHVDTDEQDGRATLNHPATIFQPVAYERLPWESQLDLDTLSRRQRDLLPATYEAAVPLPITTVGFALPTSLAAEAEDAAAAIGRLDEYVKVRFGDDDLAPMQAVLLRSESSASSQIENLTVGARQLALAELGAAASYNAALVVGNVHAMQAAVHLADHLDADAILSMHAALLGDAGAHRSGDWRVQQVRIGPSGHSPAGATFVPPHHSRVPAAIDDLVDFMRRDDTPVMVQAAVAHAQFETIHPFTDGNGRTGRALLHALLRNKRLTTRVTVPISSGLLADTASYFAALTAYRSGDIAPIVSRVCEAAHAATHQGRWLVDELTDLRHRWTTKLAPRAGSAGRRLIRVLLSQPAVDVRYVSGRLSVSETAARRAIDQAESAGLIRLASDKRRNRVWVATDVFEILDLFAARSGRRTM